MAIRRVNVSIPAEVHEQIKDAAEEYYGGNVSRYLSDAGLYYAAVLRERHYRRNDKEREGREGEQ